MFGSLPTQYRFNGAPKLTSISERLPEAGQWLFKAGRSTAYSSGYYSELKTALITETRDEYGNTVPKKTLEHAITGYHGQRFASEGDSGALVFNQHEMVVGMVFGGSKRQSVSFMTHITDVFEDIKRVTGASDVRMQK